MTFKPNGLGLKWPVCLFGSSPPDWSRISVYGWLINVQGGCYDNLTRRRLQLSMRTVLQGFVCSSDEPKKSQVIRIELVQRTRLNHLRNLYKKIKKIEIERLIKSPMPHSSIRKSFKLKATNNFYTFYYRNYFLMSKLKDEN